MILTSDSLRLRYTSFTWKCTENHKTSRFISGNQISDHCGL